MRRDGSSSSSGGDVAMCSTAALVAAAAANTDKMPLCVSWWREERRFNARSFRDSRDCGGGGGRQRGRRDNIVCSPAIHTPLFLRWECAVLPKLVVRLA